MNILSGKFNINNIVLALAVTSPISTSVHKNRSSHGFALRTSGDVTYDFEGGKKIFISPGEIIYMPKGSSYKVLNSDSGDCFAINFDIDSNQTFEPEKWNAANSKFIYDIFNLSCTLWIKNRDSFDFKIRSLLYGLLYELKSISDETHHSKEYLKIAPAVEYIENNYAKCDISVFYLANLCSTSDTQFRKIFFKIFAVTPVKYITNKRIELAKKLISSQSYRLCEIYPICGFSDACVFSRTFKKATGVSPSEYLKTL